MIFGPTIRWYEGQYTYSVPVAASTWPGYNVPGVQDPSTDPYYAVLNARQADLFREMMEVWDDLIAPDFVETDDLSAPGNIRIAVSHLPVTIGGAGAAYLPPSSQVANPSAYAGDIFLADNLHSLALSNPFDVSDYHRVVSHEIGHALGLQHTFTAPGYDLAYDTQRYSIMSYTEMAGNLVPTWLRDSQGNLTGETIMNRVFATGPMVMDIAAIQYLYGADPNTRSTDTTYTFEDYEFQMSALYDAGGIDTFDLSAHSRGSIVDLTPGAYSSIAYFEDNAEWAAWMIQQNPDIPAWQIQSYANNSFYEGRLFLGRDNLGIAFSTVIENVIGGADADVIIGNLANNTLSGGGGDDILYGFEGDDILSGGAGSDFIDGGLGQNTVAFAGNLASYSISWNGQIGTVVGADGTDTITNVAFLQFADQTIASQATGGLVIAGGVTGNLMTGSSFGDTFYGQTGDDTLDGRAGDDFLNGGDGDDTLDGGAGRDTADYADARAGVSVNLTTGIATGGAGSDTLIAMEDVNGTAFDDVIVGNNSANLLRGGGGRDELRGEGGADRLEAGAPPLDAPWITKPQATANTSLASAILLDGFFDTAHDQQVEQSTTLPHATIEAVTAGGFEYYRFTGAAGDQVVADIDNFTNINILVAQLDVLDASGNALTVTREYGQDGGFGADPTVRVTLPSSGVYYIRVGRQDVESQPATAGQNYRLNVSVSSQPLDDAWRGGSSLYGGGGDDQLIGNVGNDFFEGASGADQISGGDGSDTASYETSTGGVTVNVATGAASGGHAAGDVLTSIENLIGSAQADTLTGAAGANLLNGGLGDDFLIGGAGADQLIGGAGLDTAGYAGSSAGVTVNLATSAASGGDAAGDTLSSIENLLGSSFNDSLTGDGAANVLDGGVGDDLLTGGLGADTLIGGSGIDTASYADATSKVKVWLNLGQVGAWASGDVLSGIENLIGSAYDDVLVGDDLNNVLQGGGGADELKGGLGDDQLVGASGDDLLDGAEGNDTLVGGDNRDTLKGGDGDDSLNGGNGNDKLNAGSGADNLQGGSGDDKLAGGSDNDVIEGGTGNDRLTGGSGDDLFVFRGASGVDVITDFKAGAGLRDVISFQTSLFTSLADVKAHTANDGLGNCVISKNGVVITLMGVTRGDLVADDFVFVASAPDTEGKDFGDPLTLPPLLDDMDPLVLPTGLEAKLTPDDLPLVLPGDDGLPLSRPEIDLAELGLSDFGGRDPHRFLMQPGNLDWIV